MEDNNLKDRLKKLEELQPLLKNLEEPLKSMTAKKIMDEIFPETIKTESEEKRVKKIKGKSSNKKAKSRQEYEEKDAEMFISLNRTEYPEIYKLSSNIERALYILKIMKEKGYSGLNPSQINTILLNIFGIKSNLPAVSMALISDKKYTHKIPTTYKGAKAFEYQIMHSGEEHIKEILSNIQRKEPEENLSNSGDE